MKISGSRSLTSWMQRHQVSLGFTTYQTGKLFLIGSQADMRLSIFERSFSRCMGMWASSDSQTLWISTLYQLWRLENRLRPGETHDGYDRLYIPQASHTTGDLDVHDLAVDGDGRLTFVNTHFGCLATISDRHSFRPLWSPPWLSRMAPEDRCHLNGLAMKDGRPRWVTAVSRTDVVDGWRDRRVDGGVVADVETGNVVCTGLSMPHSPRW